MYIYIYIHVCIYIRIHIYISPHQPTQISVGNDESTTAILGPICHHAPAVTAMPCHSILQLFLAFWFEGKESVLQRMFVCGFV